MWVVVRDGKVQSVQPHKPDDIPGHDIFEWFGDEPKTHVPALADPITGYVIRPAQEADDDPRPPGYDTHIGDLVDLKDTIESEIAWLETTIPLIDGMDAAQVRSLVKRLAQENLGELRAWRYLLNRFSQ